MSDLNTLSYKLKLKGHQGATKGYQLKVPIKVLH